MRGPLTVSTHITPDTITYLAGEGTPDQQADFQAGAELIDEVYTSRYPDSPEDLETNIQKGFKEGFDALP